MKNEIVKETNKQAEEPIVIADECGDSLWDAVLAQEGKAPQTVEVDKNLKALIDRIGNIQVAKENAE